MDAAQRSGTSAAMCKTLDYCKVYLKSWGGLQSLMYHPHGNLKGEAGVPEKANKYLLLMVVSVNLYMRGNNLIS